MKRHVGLLIAAILSVVSIIMTLATADNLLDFIRIKNDGTELTTKVTSVRFNKWNQPADRIYTMQFINSEGNLVTKEYKNHSTNTDRFKIGDSIPMVIDYTHDSTFWYYPDLKSKVILGVTFCMFFYITTLVAWKYKKRLQNSLYRGDIKLGD